MTAICLVCATGFDLVLAWLIVRMVRQAGRYRSLLVLPAQDERAEPSVAVVVPARDEAANIGRCLAGLLGQDYAPDRLSITLVDDGSRDGTAEIAAGRAGNDPRFRLVRGASLPEGWTGKSFACHQGVRGTQAEYLCFMDADTAAEPALIRTAVRHAETQGIDMLSLEPFQELGSTIERLVIPCGLYLVAASQDIGQINAPDDPKAAANGQFLLIRRTAYEAVGGHASVRSEICEDSSLAARLKAAGFRFELLGAETLIQTRMYRDGASLWEGLAKNATVLGGGPARSVAIAGTGLVLVIAAFAIALAIAADLSAAPSALNFLAAALIAGGILAAVGLHLAGARHFRIPLAYGTLFPIGYALAFALACHSASLARRGRVTWKGRTYGRRDSPAPAAAGCEPDRAVDGDYAA